MLNPILIKSSKGTYSVQFTNEVFEKLNALPVEKTQLIVDEKVYHLYQEQFEFYLKSFKKILIVADENNKNIDKISQYVHTLMENQVRLDHTLVAIGGGIIQDITCFLASTLFRGMKWTFVPTTLLAQADSCIGSKSSINVAEFKNLMGTFNPPEKIYIDLRFHSTLEEKDIASGIGEILKVHMVKGISQFEKALQSFEEIRNNKEVLCEFIVNSLIFKQELIEIDEFDKGPRNVMNYGHSFGHAIESATNFAIPHGVAVTMGMDMANFQSYKMSRIAKEDFARWHAVLIRNYVQFAKVPIDLSQFMSAIRKDKKNVGADLSLILVSKTSPIEKVKVSGDQLFVNNCKEFLDTYREH